MDLEDWELLPRNNNKGLDLDEDHETSMKMIRKSFDMDYFICPTQDPVGKTELQQISNVVVPTHVHQIPVTWEPISTVEDTDQNKNSVLSPRITFNETKETEFADMKIDTQATTFTSPMPLRDEKHSESEGGLGGEGEEDSDVRSKKEIDWDHEEEKIGCERMNLWKMGLTGIGAICSFGVAAAAATICVFLLGHNSNIQGCRNKNHILGFQIYSDDNKRNNEVVKQASKLNEAISVMKSLPVARAQISFGGYNDRL